MSIHIISESKRCLQCKNARCTSHCPVETPVAEFINLYLEGKIKEAGELLFKNNPLSIVTSLVCPHSELCEGHCIRGIKSTPIEIGRIEHYVSDYYLNVMDLKPEIKLEHRIGIVGSGPAGITIAFLMALKGYKVTIFEAHDKIGGVMRYGIPEFRLPKRILDRLRDKLLELGVKIRPNTLIGKVLTLDDLFRDGYKSVFIGTGVWKPYKLNVKGETLGNVNFAIDYLKNPQAYDLGCHIVIIGAGNVAMDVARTALRNGVKDATIMYRKTLDEMSATTEEIEAAKMDGVRFEFLKTPIEFTDNGIIYKKLEKKDNKFKIIENSEEFFPTDSIIISISQGPQSNIISSTKGIDVDMRGLVKTTITGSTTREGVFASGDVVTGARTVVEAVKYSREVVDAMDKYIKEKYKE
ncbi:MAG: NAD(P)-dependent oxidoreductase [Bacillota bacterium]|nr:NAD(P)-dependent oxidoreductase [Bacillota bacterium]